LYRDLTSGPEGFRPAAAPAPAGAQAGIDPFLQWMVLAGSEVVSIGLLTGPDFASLSDGDSGDFLLLMFDFVLDGIDFASDSGPRISIAEANAIVGRMPSNTISSSQIETIVNRWNRSLDYWVQGFFTLEQLPVGFDRDFIERPAWLSAETNRLDAYGRSIAAGFRSPGHAAFVAGEEFRRTAGQQDGVCARVRIRLEQEAVLTRSAFRASIEFDNRDTSTLTGISLQLRFRTHTGTDAEEFFGVRAPELSGLSAVDGSGIVAAQSTGSATWILIPTLDAAPNGPTQYLIGGTLRFTQNGTAVTIPLADVPITVYPGPELVLDYFHERDVFSDDPFTEDVREPSIPYSLAVMARNVGRGAARNFRITSAQPKIVENEKGLLIDFNLIGTELFGNNGYATLTPSLTAEFGDIPAGTNALARWLFTSTLQGLFIDYSATFEHLDAIAGRRLSIITNVTIHEMIHLVRADRAFDDGRPDFLVDDVPDVNDRPDTLYLSDGSIEPVSVVETATLSVVPSPGNPNVPLTAALPAGWAYLRVPEPSDGRMRLAGVRRADGSLLRTENFWVTDRTFIGLGRRPIRENILHLLDYDSAGSYTLLYTNPPAADTNAPMSQIAGLPADNYERIALSWTAQDEPGGSGLAGVEVWVSENDNPPTRLQVFSASGQSVSGGTIYTGRIGRRYGFFSRAVDRSGNTEAPPGTPDATTTVSLTNRPPMLLPVSPNPTNVNEGETLRLTLSAADPDGAAQALTYQLAGVQPPQPGVVLDALSGVLTWPTGEANGPGTNVISVRVFDNGFPPYTNAQSFTVIVHELNSTPTLAAITNRIINEQQPLTFTNVASDADLPRQALVFSLAPGAPTNARVDAVSGVFAWRPNDIQGGTTNRLAVIVTDSGNPSLSATQFFTVVVRNTRSDFELALGSSYWFVGEAGALPLSVDSALPLQSVEFEFDVPLERLTPPTLTAPAVIGTLQPVAGSTNRWRASLSAGGGELPQGEELAELHFGTTINPTSAIVTLRPEEVRGGLSGGGGALQNARALPARVFVIGAEPLLDAAQATNGTRTLTLYGHPQRRYRIESTPTLESPSEWLPRHDVRLVEPLATLTPLTDGSDTVFYRAQEVPGELLTIVRAGAGFLVSWPAACAECVLESAPTPAGPWVDAGTSPQFVNGQVRWTLPAQGSSRFYRLRLR
jgi:hypothetical protein